MRTEPPTGDEFDRLIERITANVLNVARQESPQRDPFEAVGVPRRRLRFGGIVLAVLVVLGVGTAGGAFALGFVPSFSFTPAPGVTETPALTPSPSATPPGPPVSSPSAPPPVVDDTVNGFDAQLVWELCRARGVGDNATDITTEDFTPGGVVPAFDGDGVQVTIHWSNDVVGDQVFACAFDGDPGSPNLKAFEVPHGGQ